MLNELRSVTLKVSSAKDLGAALRVVVRDVQQVMGTDVCSVYLNDADQQVFVLVATEGLNQKAEGKVRLNHGEGLVGLVGQTAELINLEQAKEHPGYQLVERLNEEAFNSFMGVPIIHQQEQLGVLVVQDRQVRRYSEDEETFLSALSAQLAGVIAHAWATGSVKSLVLPDDAQGASRFAGVPGAPGVTMGVVHAVLPLAELSEVPDRKTDRVERELAAFNKALSATRAQVADMGDKLSNRLQAGEMELFEVYLQMLEDSGLGGEVTGVIREGYEAQTALRRVVEKHVEAFQAMEDPYLRERAVDVRDLGNRILGRLQQPDDQAQIVIYPDQTILVAQELTPAMVAEVPPENLVGLASAKGSSNSHVAILARAMGVPTVVGAVDMQPHLIHEQPVVVDAFDGSVIVNPSAEQENQYRRIMEDEADLVKGLEELRDKPSETADGHRVNLWVNTALMTDVVRSMQRGAEGVGLYRTEVHFMMGDRFPTETEQVAIYRQHLVACAPKPVTMRTLDIGGDKPLAYFPISEENPCLGWRGIRFTLDHPEIFLAQVRAMLRASSGSESELRIMLPMVANLHEVDEAIKIIRKCHRELVDEGYAVVLPNVGVMIEVPAAVYQVKQIARKVDFLSVGSNDLVQYLLAVDRNNPQVSNLYQEFHPSVLQALKLIADSSRTLTKSLSICGEMAGHPGGALLLVAMGYDTLSMGSANLPVIKSVLRTFELDAAKQLLNKALNLDHAHEIRQMLDDELTNAGHGRLVQRHKRRG